MAVAVDGWWSSQWWWGGDGGRSSTTTRLSFSLSRRVATLPEAAAAHCRGMESPLLPDTPSASMFLDGSLPRDRPGSAPVSPVGGPPGVRSTQLQVEMSQHVEEMHTLRRVNECLLRAIERSERAGAENLAKDVQQLQTPSEEESREVLKPSAGKFTSTVASEASRISRSSSPSALLEQDIRNFEQQLDCVAAVSAQNVAITELEMQHSLASTASLASSLDLDFSQARLFRETLVADMATQRRQTAAMVDAAVGAARREERKRFAAAFRKIRLRALADKACQRQQAAIELNAAVDAATRAAEMAVHESYQNEAAKAAAAAAAAAAARRRACCICCDSFGDDNGVSCPAEHFTCNDCLVGCIKVRFLQNLPVEDCRARYHLT